MGDELSESFSKRFAINSQLCFALTVRAQCTALLAFLLSS